MTSSPSKPSSRSLLAALTPARPPATTTRAGGPSGHRLRCAALRRYGALPVAGPARWATAADRDGLHRAAAGRPPRRGREFGRHFGAARPHRNNSWRSCRTAPELKPQRSRLRTCLVRQPRDGQQGGTADIADPAVAPSPARSWRQHRAARRPARPPVLRSPGGAVCATVIRRRGTHCSAALLRPPGPPSGYRRVVVRAVLPLNHLGAQGWGSAAGRVDRQCPGDTEGLRGPAMVLQLLYAAVHQEERERFLCSTH